MGLPILDITFKSAAKNTIKKATSGVVGLIVRDVAKAAGGYTLTDPDDIPQGLTQENTDYIARSFAGYVNTPTKVELFVVSTDAENMDDAMEYMATHPYNFLAAPPDVAEAECAALVAWGKVQRAECYNTGKLVLPHTAADDELVINVTAEENQAGKATYSAAQYCSRVAGMLAGTPLTIASTYAPLGELSDTKRLTRKEANAAIDAGEFIFIYDGEKVKVGRGVNSLTTTTPEKGEDLKKIKVVEIRDLISGDLRRTIQDNWIGKQDNSYDDKVLLMTAIRGYLTDLEDEGLLVKGGSSVEINVERQRAYLKEQDVNVSAMDEQSIKEANTGSHVFLRVKIKIQDAMEDVYILVEM